MWNIFDMMLKWFYAWNKLKQQRNMTVIVHQTDLPCMGLQQIPSWKKTAENSFSITWGTWNWADTKRSCDIIFMKMKVIWFFILGHILNKVIVIWVFKPAAFSWNEYVPCWLRDQNVIFNIMNYLFLNTNFAFKLQGECWKDDVVTSTAR